MTFLIGFFKTLSSSCSRMSENRRRISLCFLGKSFYGSLRWNLRSMGFFSRIRFPRRYKTKTLAGASWIHRERHKRKFESFFGEFPFPKEAIKLSFSSTRTEPSSLVFTWSEIPRNPIYEAVLQTILIHIMTPGTNKQRKWAAFKYLCIK